MSRMPLPADRLVQPRLVGYDPTHPRPWLERIAYTLFFSALWVMVILAYGAVPALFRHYGWLSTTAGFLIYAAVEAVLAFLLAAVVALILIVVLRKYLGKVQERVGPMHYGPAGVFQTVFDALKLLGKEDFAPKRVDWLIFRLAPAIVFVSAFLLMVALPVAGGWVMADLNVGLLYIVAVSTLGAYGVVLGGLSQGNKWGLLGGFRAGAQLVSYEVPLALALLSVGVYSGSLRLSDVVEHQYGLWHVVPLFLSFLVYLVASIAELKATPFDLPEAESELVAGYNTEYSGMSFAFFFLAEFVELFLLPGFMVVLFFGGWHGPLFGLEPGSFAAGVLQSLYFLVKVAVWVWIFLWIRATLPRFRDDQLMDLAWKGLLPLALVGLLVAAFLRMFLEVL